MGFFGMRGLEGSLSEGMAEVVIEGSMARPLQSCQGRHDISAYPRAGQVRGVGKVRTSTQMMSSRIASTKGRVAPYFAAGRAAGLAAGLCVALASIAPGRAQAGYWSLEEAARRALGRAPAMLEAAGIVGTARALGQGARVSSLQNPYLEATGEHGRTTKDVNIVSSLFLPVEVSGQRGARIEESERLIDWRGAQRGDVRAQVVASTVLAYGAVLVANGRLDQATRAAVEAQAEAAAYTARLKQADVTLYDVSVIEAEAARWIQLKVSASAELSQATARLAQLTGERPVGPIPPWSAPPVINMPIGDLLRKIDESPVLKALGKETLYWTASKERAEAERWAPLSFVVTGGRGDLGETRIGGGLAWTLPFFRRNQGEIARAQAERIRAETLLPATKIALEERTRGAFDTYRGVLQGLEEHSKFGIPAAGRAVTAAAEAQRSGKGEMIQVLISRRDLASARARQLDLVELAWRAYADLVFVLGPEAGLIRLQEPSPPQAAAAESQPVSPEAIQEQQP